MKKLLTCCLMLVLSAAAGAAPVFDSLGAFSDAGRHQTNVYDTTILSNSVLRELSNRALKWISVDVGGVERRFQFVTVSGRSSYAIPDSTTEILSGSGIGQTGDFFSLKLLPPQYQEDMRLTELTPGDMDQHPFSMWYWQDTLDLAPTPVLADTIKLRLYVEHEPLSSDSMSLQLRPAYHEAALWYLCYLIADVLEMDQKAVTYEAQYEKIAEKLRRRYARQPDAVP